MGECKVQEALHETKKNTLLHWLKFMLDMAVTGTHEEAGSKFMMEKSYNTKGPKKKSTLVVGRDCICSVFLTDRSSGEENTGKKKTYISSVKMDAIKTYQMLCPNITGHTFQVDINTKCFLKNDNDCATDSL